MKNYKEILREVGIKNPTVEDWLWLNFKGIKENSELKKFVAPFPPLDLIHNVSGLDNELDFASHGVDIYRALDQASSVPWDNFNKVLDFGSGCGRVARMFKGHNMELNCVDIDSRHIEWIKNNLSYVTSKVNMVNEPLPYDDDMFDCIYSISVLTHVNENYQDFLLNELSRISKPEAYLFLTVHGKRALERALSEKAVFKMLEVENSLFNIAKEEFCKGKHAFILQQQGHLTSERYQYGITFIPESYIYSNWSKWFNIIKVCHGAIHDFQDIVVLKKK